jgi:hypothetical protein
MLFVVSILWDELRHRVRQLHEPGRDRGASALEWAIIAAISVVIATIIGAVVYNVVNNKSNDIQKCGDQPVGSKC